ncbi:hypothetical protein ANCDUO_14622 [Ancylostoma duodenale]|uniref:Acyltransferase 3 domain-containing protein n=1 Tax=Ancylostoma duodenale TaxID=51022 RepID=A0A0C2G2R3_9BILA|nr:hypothetical protein ANCDUO_14622 [Ancylostoma duodenale]
MSEKRLDIQGLRGWAVTSVVLFHFFPNYFPNGYIGVDISQTLRICLRIRGRSAWRCSGIY